jgi:DNA-directed RNA polymerase subunit beta'
MAQVTTLGREKVKKALPPKYRDFQGALGKKELGKLYTRIAQEDPELYADTLHKLNTIGANVASLHGGAASLKPDDFKVPPEIAAKRDKLKADVQKVYDSPLLNTEQKEKTVLDMVQNFSKTIDEDLLKAVSDRDGAFALQIIGAGRGKPFQLRQLLLGNLISADSRGNAVPYPNLDGYAGGVSPLAYFAASHGGRKGYVDVQFATADAGYFGKQLTNVSHRSVVTEEDCGTTSGIELEGDDQDNVGTVLAKDVGPLKAGTILDDENTALIKNKQILGRSALTCEAKEGVCAKCAGVRETGALPSIGDRVGVTGARSFVEPLTQAAISSKHAGGEIGATKKHETGFKAVNKFFQVPKEFPGEAKLAEIDGKVSAIKKAPQGGKYVMIGSQRHWVPEDRDVKVRQGDVVEAGDMISEGMLNASAIVKHKGIGEGRVYFLKHLRDLLDRSNSGTNRRNLEYLTSQFIGKVRITDPDGVNGHLPDDVINYNTLASQWKPRKGAALKSITTSNKLYLEKPYLHYTIGTRITPRIAKKLQKAGIKNVLAHKEPPPFEPEVIRAQDYMATDPDFQTQLAGENLKRTLTRAATRGATSEKQSISYFPRLVNIEEV